jgi:hypothetical protein
MRMTNNRKLILQALQDGDGYDLPPYSASSVHYILENAYRFKWEGYEMKTLPSVIQIHRTLRDLWHSGLIVGTRKKADWYDNALPCWIVEYQLSSEVERNHIISECTELHKKLNKAVNGINFFGAAFDKGLPAEDVEPLKSKVRLMMQRTHPDKSPYYAEQFKLMRECHEWIKQGIPTPEEAKNANNQKEKINRLK